jgi:hypothetical protein
MRSIAYAHADAQSVKSEAARRAGVNDWYAIRKSDTGEGHPRRDRRLSRRVRTRSGEIETLDPIPPIRRG